MSCYFMRRWLCKKRKNYEIRYDLSTIVLKSDNHNIHEKTLGCNIKKVSQKSNIYKRVTSHIFKFKYLLY